MRLRALVLFFLILLGGWFFFWDERSPQASPSYKDHQEMASDTLKKKKNSNSARLPSSTLASSDSEIKEMNLDDLAQSIQENRYCDFQNQNLLKNELHKKPQERLGLIYKSLVKSAQTEAPVNPCILALTTHDRSIALKYSQSSNDVACRFIQALLLTDQMEPSDKQRPVVASERQQGIKILSELGSQDPTNGIYPFFLVGAYEPGSKSPEKELALSKFTECTKFENPLSSLFAEIRALGERNGTAFLYSIEVISAINFPNYRSFKEFKNDFASHPTPSKIRWIANTRQRFQSLASENIGEPFVFLLDLSILKNIANSIDETAKPFEENWWLSFYRQISRSAEIEDALVIGPNQPGCQETLKSADKMVNSYIARFWDEKRRFERLSDK